ncbi:sensor histidine kinase [Psychroserpens sp.]
MKLKIVNLFVWCLMIFFMLGPLRVLAETQDFYNAFKFVFVLKTFILFVSSIIAFVAYSVVVYVLLIKFYKRNKGFVFGLIIISIPVIVFFRYVLQEIVMLKIFGFGNYVDNYGLMNYFFDNLYYAIIYTTIGIVFFFNQYSNYVETKSNILLLKDKQARLFFLRSQLNPHFLFNNLNSIYSLVSQNNVNALSAIEKVSNILRYSLYQSEKKVKVSQELDYIEDFIELQRQRHSFKLNILLEVADEVKSKHIPPFIIIPFIENAFKHGDLKNQPVYFSVFMKGGQFCFKAKNSVLKQQKDTVGGIGIDNIKQRLMLLYENKHSLIINETETLFIVDLKITI